jgi:hypothetical protein
MTAMIVCYLYAFGWPHSWTEIFSPVNFSILGAATLLINPMVNFVQRLVGNDGLQLWLVMQTIAEFMLPVALHLIYLTSLALLPPT